MKLRLLHLEDNGDDVDLVRRTLARAGIDCDILERKVAQRTAEVERRDAEIEMLNKELETFSHSVAHDLRSPLITIDGFAQVLLENIADTLDEANRNHLERISTAVRRMHRLINDLLELSKIVRAPIHRDTVDPSGSPSSGASFTAMAGKCGRSRRWIAGRRSTLRYRAE
jgi:signal transduction histidine kinase